MREKKALKQRVKLKEHMSYSATQRQVEERLLVGKRKILCGT